MGTLVAASHGLEAAVLYQYFAWNIHKFGKWTGTMDMLLGTFPYMSEKSLRLTLHKMLGRVKGYPRLISRISEGQQFIYRITKPIRGGSFHALDPKMAMAYGMLAAIVYDNVVYWISMEGGECQPTIYSSPAAWQKSHDYAPLISVKRAFKTLLDHGELVLVGRRNGRTPVYTIPLGEGKLDRWTHLHIRPGVGMPSDESLQKQMCCGVADGDL
jgi:hypothetical protein